MEFTELINNRYSVRKYLAKPIEQEKLDKVLEAARIAPTAKNLQQFKIFVIPTDKYKENLLKIYQREWFVEAPLVLLICGASQGNWVRGDGKNYNDIDVTIAMDHLILEATNQGLGTCWIGAFDCETAKKELSLPIGFEPIIFTPLGYFEKEPKEKKRKSLEALIEYL